MSKNTQVGIRLPNDLYAHLESERLQALERGEKVTMTELIVKHLRHAIGQSEPISSSTVERLTNVLERLEAKL